MVVYEMLGTKYQVSSTKYKVQSGKEEHASEARLRIRGRKAAKGTKPACGRQDAETQRFAHK